MKNVIPKIFNPVSSFYLIALFCFLIICCKYSVFLFEMISPFVLESFNLHPVAMLNFSNSLKVSVIVWIFVVIVFVSSAYCVNFSVSLQTGSFILCILLFRLILFAKVSAMIQNSGKEIGHPCHMPLCMLIRPVRKPLFITIEVLSLYIFCMKFTNLSPKLKCFSVSII